MLFQIRPDGSQGGDIRHVAAIPPLIRHRLCNEGYSAASRSGPQTQKWPPDNVLQETLDLKIYGITPHTFI